VGLRGGERGICLRTPFQDPLEVFRAYTFLIFREKRIIYSYNILRSSLSRNPSSDAASERQCTATVEKVQVPWAGI